MKIAIPLLGFGRAGGQRVLSRLATELTELGHEVYLIVPDDGVQAYYPTNAKQIRTKKTRTRFRLFNLLSNYYHIWSALKAVTPDLAVANHHLTAYLVWLLPRKIKKCYYIQAYEVVFGSNNITKLIAYLTYLLPLNKIVNSSTILPKKLNNYIGVVPAGIDLDLYYPRTSSQISKRSIGLIGRKEKHKGTKEIIQLLSKWGQDKKIIVNVAVFLSEENKEYLENNRIAYNFTPISNDGELANFYRSNDLIIATGLVEDGAFHYPCAEAMACGCSVISNYAPLVHSKSILKIETFNTKFLEEKLELFYEADEVSIHNELAANISLVSDYSWRNVSKKFDSYITQIYKELS
ncbi:glycosyltransferase family 4 protein [Huaxiibacter chinensis]